MACKYVHPLEFISKPYKLYLWFDAVLFVPISNLFHTVWPYALLKLTSSIVHIHYAGMHITHIAIYVCEAMVITTVCAM